MGDRFEYEGDDLEALKVDLETRKGEFFIYCYLLLMIPLSLSHDILDLWSSEDVTMLC